MGGDGDRLGGGDDDGLRGGDDGLGGDGDDEEEWIDGGGTGQLGEVGENSTTPALYAKTSCPGSRNKS